MKKLSGVVFASAVVLLASTAAHAATWGVGGFGGINIPIIQDDAENGSVYGAHLKLGLGSILTLEPNFTFFSNGEWSIDDAPNDVFPGANMYKIGVNVLLGGGGPPAGLRFYGLGGVGYYNFDIDTDNKSVDYSQGKLGWNAGIGIEIGGGPISFDVRGTAEIMPLEGDGSRKWVQARGGVNYYFGGN